jgi:hypothetical protein
MGKSTQLQIGLVKKSTQTDTELEADMGAGHPETSSQYTTRQDTEGYGGITQPTPALDGRTATSVPADETPTEANTNLHSMARVAKKVEPITPPITEPPQDELEVEHKVTWPEILEEESSKLEYIITNTVKEVTEDGQICLATYPKASKGELTSELLVRSARSSRKGERASMQPTVGVMGPPSPPRPLIIVDQLEQKASQGEPTSELLARSARFSPEGEWASTPLTVEARHSSPSFGAMSTMAGVAWEEATGSIELGDGSRRGAQEVTADQPQEVLAMHVNGVETPNAGGGMAMARSQSLYKSGSTNQYSHQLHCPQEEEETVS